ncbi:MAG: hypothetical protein ACFCUR_15155 [Rhodomicrobiaceae bacterium]
MRRPAPANRRKTQQPATAASSAMGLNLLSYAAAAMTACFLAWVLYAGPGMRFLTPGPLSASHAAIEQCSTCHTAVGKDSLSWIHGIFVNTASDDNKACLSCHVMGGNAGNPHGVASSVLERSTERLRQVAASTPTPQFANIRNFLFPSDRLMNGNASCASCHREHEGGGIGSLALVSNEQCQACHSVQFDSFDGNHPKFDNYPFKRRTRIAYDHMSHFGKHFPEILSKNDATKRIPTTCSNCHSTREDRNHMSVASFDQTCASCHLDQITGKERAIGPKGVAFLTLPGIDVQTLKDNNIDIGEWPEFSEAELTPFMKMLLARTPRGKAMIDAVSSLDLLDLTQASDAELKVVEELVWDIKGLFYELVISRASDVMASFADIAGPQLGAGAISNLSANLPRDVVMNAQQNWLPNLGADMANRTTPASDTGEWTSSTTETKLAGSVSPDEIDAGGPRLTAPAPYRPAGETGPRLAQAADNSGGGWRIDPFGRPINDGESPPADAPPEAAAPDAEANDAAPPEGLFAPEEALQADPADDPAGSEAEADAAPDAPVIAAPLAIESDVDAESWADHGGWYRQDFAILYRPVGHKDRFLKSWVDLSSWSAANAGSKASAQLFTTLTSKDAQGQCSKCHSIDRTPRGGQVVNWSPAKVTNKKARFTTFTHEPHFRVLDKRDNEGCLTCHDLKRDGEFEQSYKRDDPRGSTGSFKPVEKELCQTCHKQDVARQDCLLCHKYHVNGTVTPIMSTKVPSQ